MKDEWFMLVSYFTGEKKEILELYLKVEMYRGRYLNRNPSPNFLYDLPQMYQ